MPFYLIGNYKDVYLKKQDSIKLIIFTAPSKMFLTGTGYFFLLPVSGHEEHNDY